MKTNISNCLKSGMLLAVVFSFNFLFAQSQDAFVIKWGAAKTLSHDNKEFQVPFIEDQRLNGNKPHFFFRQKTDKNINTKFDVDVVSSELIPTVDLNYLKSQHIVVGELDYSISISSSGTDKHFVINFFPYYKENGQIKRVKEFKVVERESQDTPVYGIKGFAVNSVLMSGSGSWYKIGVRQDGIYKLDKAFLESCGVDVDNLNPDHLHIYGNGDGKLPELNSIPRTDDLVNNAISIVGAGDGSFDDEDYVLFYGWGPHRWYSNGTDGYDQERHPYSDVSCYFININAGEPANRIADVPDSPLPVSQVVTSYNFKDVHEVDAVNLVGGGQRWYGELFDSQLQRTFVFNVSDIDQTSPARFNVSIASNTNGTAGTSHTYSVNGSVIGSSTLPAGAEYGRQVMDLSLANPPSNLPLQISVVRNQPSTLTYLDRIVLNARRQLRFSGTQFNFSDLNSVGTGNVANFVLENLPSGGFVWDVTDRHNPNKMIGSVSGSNFEFVVGTDQQREFVASDGVNFLTPTREGVVEHQNLHGLPQADYLIVTHKNFLSQANRLANLHRAQGTTVHVVRVDQIYNEFSSGMQDATAIKMFAKMFYDRGASNPSTRPKSLLLFGDGTYDPKGRVPDNNNFIVTYQMLASEDYIQAMVTDDYFGMLDDGESIGQNDELDIGVGRLLISDNEIARQQVDKIQHYMHNGSNLYSTENTNCSSEENANTFGDWRTKYVQIADDEEDAYFIIRDVEPQYDTVTKNFPEMNCDKIYLDAYTQVSTAGGQRYPDVNHAINDRIERGALVVNYVGHGGEVGVAEERVITVPQIQAWKNIDKLTLLVSATCEFTKFDDPSRVSAGEWASLNPYGGAIALMTTTRSVYFGVNTETGKSFFENVFKRDANFEPRTFGEIIRTTKNGVPGSNNKRSFTLIGDPHLKIALPRMRVFTDSINGLDPAVQMDTLRALSKVTIKGHVEDHNGNTLTGFNGFLYPSVYDKPKIQQTLMNDASSPVQTFELQTNRLYRGKASVVNGAFEFTFIVPKDINYSFDFGKISYYSENGVYDAIGEDKRVYVGGVDPNGLSDDVGPDIEIYLNDESFVSGGITDETPQLIVKVFDENGINAVGNGVGHDLTAVLDQETSNPYVLNDYYTSDLDSYQSGEIRYNFEEISPGRHTVTVKVWDVNNNSSERTIDFEVREKQELSLEHVINYPNPFSTSTEFYFEHNQVCSQLEAQIQILTVSGKLIKTINKMVHTEGFRSEGIHWDGRDDFGDQIGKGVYIYRLSVRTPEGNVAEKLEKLVILK